MDQSSSRQCRSFGGCFDAVLSYRGVDCVSPLPVQSSDEAVRVHGIKPENLTSVHTQASKSSTIKLVWTSQNVPTGKKVLIIRVVHQGMARIDTHTDTQTNTNTIPRV